MFIGISSKGGENPGEDYYWEGDNPNYTTRWLFVSLVGQVNLNYCPVGHILNNESQGNNFDLLIAV